MTKPLSPYDRGEVAEPVIWGVHENTDADRYGFVDFDDDGGDHIATVRVVRDHERGGWTLMVAYSEAEPFTIVADNSHIVTISPEGDKSFGEL